MVGVMVRRQNPMRVLAVCSAAGLVVAVALLGGVAQGLVAMVSGVLLLVAVAAGLDNEESRAQERHLDSGDRAGGGPSGGF
jgi:peptidoglycan/LPS O-acetylase OafA/YrhL